MTYGLALSGGALRGAAHIGILEVLQEEGLPPQILAGTSAGSIIGGLYAAGIRPKIIENLFNRLCPVNPPPKGEVIRPLPAEPVTIQNIAWLPLPKGLVNGNFIEKFMERNIGGITFEELSVPFAVVTTDLHSGETVVFTAEKLIPPKPWPSTTIFVSGARVAEAVQASSAIPGIFTPKTIGQRTLMDGGLVSNVPADILKVLGSKKVIAVDLGFGVQEQEPLKNLVDILLQTYDIMGQRVSNLVLEYNADLVIRPRTGNAGLLDFSKIPGFIEKGRLTAREHLEKIKQIIKG